MKRGRGRPPKPKTITIPKPKGQRGRPKKEELVKLLPNYRGIYKKQDEVIFVFLGGMYKGIIYDFIEETDYGPLMFLIKSGDTNYPIRIENIKQLINT
jgi:hypothetical protein